MMGKPNFGDEFKREAVAQIAERGNRVADVSQRLGASQPSLYARKRHLAKVVSGDAGEDAQIRQLKRELARVTGIACIRTREGFAGLSPIEFERQQILKAEGIQKRSGHSS